MTQSTYNRLPQTPGLVRTQDATSPGGEVRSIGKFLASSQYKGKKYVAKRMCLVKRVKAVNTEVFSDIVTYSGRLGY